MERKNNNSLVIFIGAILVFGGGFYLYQSNQSTTTASTTSAATTYIQMNASLQDLNVTVQGTGNVYAATSKSVVAQNSGEVSSFSLNVGDKLTKGQAICTVYDDQITSKVDDASLNLEKAQLQLTNAKNDSEKEMQQLSVDSAENSLAQAKSQRSKMYITSPIDGVVTEKLAENGDQLQSGKSIVTVVDPNSLKIKVAVDELDIAKIKTGQKATITFGALEGNTYTGKVESISSIGTTNSNVTTYDVIVTLEKPKDVKLGMTATVNIDVASKSKALSVPLEAIVTKNDKKYVRVQSGNSKSGELVEIKTGIKSDDYQEVLSGVTDGQTLLVELPQSTSSSNQTMRFGGEMGGFGGGGFNDKNRQGGQGNKQSGAANK